MTVCESVVPATMCTGEVTVEPFTGRQMVTDGFTLLSVQPVEVPPVPVSETVCVPAESLMVRVPVRVPVALGVKVTLMVQLAPAPSDVPQLFPMPKSPVTLTPLMDMALPVPLESVTVCAGLVVPTVWLPNVSEP